jgi:hypothetical protein
MLKETHSRAREEKIVPPCEDDLCEFFRSEWSRVGPRWSSRLRAQLYFHPCFYFYTCAYKEVVIE